MTSTSVMSAGVEVQNFNYLRPGDFIPWSSHVVYVAAPANTDDDGEEGIDTLEAQPPVVGNELGRTRYSRRDKSYLLQRGQSGAKYRRWRTP